MDKLHEPKQKILVIDDDPDIRDIISTTLEARGYEVLTAATGNDGLKVAKSTVPDLILLDIMLPDMNGYELCTQLRSLKVTSEISVVMMTAADQPSDVVRGFVVGTDEYVTKPFGIEELVARINAQLRRRKITRSKV
ncbi:MAG: response regulator transcription factor [Chloroflexi bacterium]|nr:response regulator transcription factor [Chloroflexota bacterium]